MKQLNFLLALCVVLLVSACVEEFELDTPAPTIDDANIAMDESTSEANVFVFTNDADAFRKVWEFSTGQSLEGDTVSLYVPFAGEYGVKLTIYNAGGSSSIESTFTVTDTDPSICSKELLTLLTGGCAATNGKTWVVDSASAGHFGLGPVDAVAPIWYAAVANEKIGGGFYDDRYTFFLNNSAFSMQTNGDVYINNGQGPNFPGSFESPVGDLTAPFTSPESLTYSIDESGDNPVIKISAGGFLGYFTGVREYEILELTEDVLFVKYLDNVNDFSWYQRFIRAGFSAPVDPVDPGAPVNLPIDFEGGNEPAFDVFGGNSFAVIDNPDPSGLNTSNRVASTTHGNEVWGGVVVELANPIDLSTSTAMSVKLWAPVTGSFLLKLEHPTDPNIFIEKEVAVETANEWIELTVDFAGGLTDTYTKVAVFPGWQNNAPETYYFDDIQQVTAPAPPVVLPITFENGEEPAFGVFGGSVWSVIDNPGADAVNGSARVGSVVHGNETWAGVSVDVTTAVDLSATPVLKVKVWSPIATDFLFKFEKIADANDFVEIQQPITQTNQWVELTFDFTGVSTDAFGRIAIFPGFGTTDPNTFYVDDITAGN